METTVISRRDFIKSGSAAALGIAMLPQALKAQGQEKRKLKIAAQMYSVRDACKVNFDKALEDVAKIGFEGVEFAGFWNYSGKPKELKKRLDSLGLVAAGTHLGTGSFRGDNLKRTIDFYTALDCKYLICPGDGDFTNPEKYKALAEFYSETAAKLRNYGLYCGYHNHTNEFKVYNNKTYWDHFAENTIKEVVLQQDCGWSYVAGQDPAQLIRKYPGRTQITHFKPAVSKADYGKKKAIIGQDSVPWVETIKACREVGATEWVTIEQETYPDKKSSMECLQLSFEGLKALL